MAFPGAAGANIPRSNSSGYNLRQTPNFSPDQMKLFQQLLGGLNKGGGLQGGIDYLGKLAGGDEEAFGQIEKPAYSAFQGLLGNIGSRFAGAGAIGSSAFQNATSGAAQSLAENLGSQRHGIQMGALDKLLGLSDKLLGYKPNENFMEGKRSGFDTFGDIASIISKFLPFFL